MSPLVLLCIALHLIDASVIPPLLSHHLLSGGRHGDRNFSNSISSLHDLPSHAETEVYVTLPETSTDVSHAFFGDDNDEIDQSPKSVKFTRFHDGTTNHFDTSSDDSLSPTTLPSNSREEHHHKHHGSSGHGNGEKVENMCGVEEFIMRC